MPAVDHAEQIKLELAENWIPYIYSERILKLRTRSYRIDAKPRLNKVAIQHTLLGIELKIGSRRLLCPDLATARYLSVFARVGCNSVAIPYDITRISWLADELESSWYRMLLLAEATTRGWTETASARLRGLLFAKIRTEIEAAGSGTKIPEFPQPTKQRRST